MNAEELNLGIVMDCMDDHLAIYVPRKMKNVLQEKNMYLVMNVTRKLVNVSQADQ